MITQWDPVKITSKMLTEVVKQKQSSTRCNLRQVVPAGRDTPSFTPTDDVFICENIHKHSAFYLWWYDP